MGIGRDWDNPEQMISVDDALERILARFSPLPAVETPIVEALAMVVTRDIISTVDVPPFRNSAMDGYAVQSADTAEAPVMLRVVATVAAGSMPDCRLRAGEAIRIMTGAPIPEGADAVVRFEETDERARSMSGAQLTRISVSRAITKGENVREAGEDIHANQAVLSTGARLGPAEIGVLASLNMATAPVHRRPRVAILSTGDEVVDVGPELLPGQIRNSNSYTMSALVRQAGGDPILLGVARDSSSSLTAKLRSVERPDLFITTGGVSVGDYDVVKDLLRAEGSVDMWQVRMKPGKPLAFGKIGGVPLLGLPGNPLAALVSFIQFGRPAIRKMLGLTELLLPVIDAVLTEQVTNAGGRRHFVRAIVERASHGLEAQPTGGRGSGLLAGAMHANGFIVIPEGRVVVDAGDTVCVQLLDDVLVT
ncbi:MAG: gephyrin-like molybdotransferase Glp [Thermomicrobiales bacterium]